MFNHVYNVVDIQYKLRPFFENYDYELFYIEPFLIYFVNILSFSTDLKSYIWFQ